MTSVLIDDHLLRDVLAGDGDDETRELLNSAQLGTTNMYCVRLSRSVVAARGGQLTGGWPASRRSALGRALLVLPEMISVVPIRSLAYRMAELAAGHRLSTLGAEAVAAAELTGAALWVRESDDGPEIRAACVAVGVDYHTRSITSG